MNGDNSLVRRDDDDGLLDRVQIVQINKSPVNRFDLTNSLSSRICRLCKQLNVFSR